MVKQNIKTMKKLSKIIGCLIILSWIAMMFLVNRTECCEIAAQEAAEIAVQKVYESEGWRIKK